MSRLEYLAGASLFVVTIYAPFTVAAFLGGHDHTVMPYVLVAALLSGWAAYGAGDAKGAVANIDKLTGPEWYPIFKDLHTGMILELAGKEKEAGVRLERAYKVEDSMLRVSDDYARWLSRNKDAASAEAVYDAFEKKLPRHPLVQDALREIIA